MAQRKKLVYQDFRPLRQGEAPNELIKARRYISPSTGEIITRRTFQAMAGSPAVRTGTGGNADYRGKLDAYTYKLNKEQRRLESELRDQGLTFTPTVISKKEVAQSSSFQDLYKDYKKWKNDTSGSKRAKRQRRIILDELGVLDPDWKDQYIT